MKHFVPGILLLIDARESERKRQTIISCMNSTNITGNIGSL